jgi:hypothetical protein
MTDTEKSLRETFRNMNVDHATEIRRAYYKAMEGLQTLADMLELADAVLPGPTNEQLMAEHLLACAALDTMGKSELGRVL